jgi:tagatose 6-phosphate kinase
LARDADVVVLSGSLPPGAPPDAYARLTGATTSPVILDAGGPALTAGVAARPAVVKPNTAELAAATGLQGVLEGAGALRARGAETVVVSDGPAGMTLFTGPPVASGSPSDLQGWHAAPPEAVRGNPTGAGDAAAAALARGLAAHTPWPEVLADAVALSAAAVAAPLAGSFDAALYARLRPLITPVPADRPAPESTFPEKPARPEKSGPSEKSRI